MVRRATQAKKRADIEPLLSGIVARKTGSNVYAMAGDPKKETCGDPLQSARHHGLLGKHRASIAEASPSGVRPTKPQRSSTATANPTAAVPCKKACLRAGACNYSPLMAITVIDPRCAFMLKPHWTRLRLDFFIPFH